MGSSRDVEGVYEKMMELRIATPQVRIRRYLESRRCSITLFTSMNIIASRRRFVSTSGAFHSSISRIPAGFGGSIFPALFPAMAGTSWNVRGNSSNVYDSRGSFI